MKTLINPRHGFMAPPGYSIISCDFASQETLVAAALSHDPLLTQSFTAPKFILPDGTLTRTEGPTTHQNPQTDLHTISTRAFCFPQIFEGKSEYDWVNTAETKGLIPLPGKPRRYGKIVNYFLQYLGTAESLAELCHVEVDTAKGWVAGHAQLYEVFHDWTQRIGAIGESRGWIETSWGQRVRWVSESNSKNAGESPIRASVSHAIQGICADIGKVALIKILRKIEGTAIQLCNFVHDEVVLMAPGHTHTIGLRFDEDKQVWLPEEEEVWEPDFEGDEQITETAEMIKKIMEEVEAEMIDHYLPGAASYKIAPYWNH